MRYLFIPIAYSLIIVSYLNAQGQVPDYKNPNLSFEQRVKDLASRLTLEEKVAQLSNQAPAIERLGVPAFNYQGEALHGIAEAHGGKLMQATSFPQSINMGSTWNPELMKEVATAISDEAVAFHKKGEIDLSFWSPNINMLRDPRWGRNEEAYSEDPYLMSQIAVSFVKGLQGEHPKYLKTIATPKHFVANNSEFNRHTGNSQVVERWLREYYFPAYKACFHEGRAFSTMCAYNRVNGVPACGNEWLLTTILRDEWGFEGYVVSDCGAIFDIYENHHYVETAEEASALAVDAGCELNCGFVYEDALLNAVRQGLISEEKITRAVERLFLGRYKLGLFAPETELPYRDIDEKVIESREHMELAQRAARESIILLKNEDNMLPLSKDIESIAVIGPNATNTVLGSYHGVPSRKISTLQGIIDKVGDQIEVHYERGSNIHFKDKLNFDPSNYGVVVGETEPQEAEEEYYLINEEYQKEIEEPDSVLIPKAVELARKVDKVILVMGTNRFISYEEKDAADLSWPGYQSKLIQEVYKANPNVVLVLVNGYQIAINWEKTHIPAILETWHAGQEQGVAIADVLFGDYNPGGKLPVTYYKSESDLPPIEDYDITKGRTYWFFEKEVLFPFGHGLSYTNFEYSNLQVDKTILNNSNDRKIALTVDIKNTGPLKGDEVIQVYLRDLESEVLQPIKKLRAFKRITLEKGKTITVSFELHEDDFQYWNEENKMWDIEPGEFEIQVGSSSEDIKLKKIIVWNK